MPQLSLLQGGPLAFPGTLPGLDISKDLQFSGVANNGNILNLKTVKAGTVAGGIQGRIRAGMGPTVFDNTSGNITYSGFSTTAVTSCTASAIFQRNGTGASSMNAIFQTSTATTGVMLATGVFGNAGAAGQLNLSFYNVVAIVANTIIIPVGVPYFVWASANNTSGTSYTVYFVARNLQNGEIFSQTVTTTGNPLAGNGTFEAVGAVALSAVMDLSACAFEATGYPLGVGLQRAADPFAFWYPRSFLYSLDWLGGAAVAPPPTLPPPVTNLLFV